MFYDPSLNCAYCDDCSSKMTNGQFDWSDADYVASLETKTIEQLQEWWNQTHKINCAGECDKPLFVSNPFFHKKKSIMSKKVRGTVRTEMDKATSRFESKKQEWKREDERKGSK